jgi:hypothetical protein
MWGNLSIAQAREAARVRLGQVAKGISPRAERLRLKAEDERERAEAALSLEALVDEWAELHLAHRRERYRDEAQRAIKNVFADLLKRPAARITRAEVINILDKLIRNGTPAMAARALAYARAAFNWAARREKIPANPLVGLPVITGTAERDRVLTDAELSEIWAATSHMTYPWGPFFRLAILTLQRREEVEQGDEALRLGLRVAEKTGADFILRGLGRGAHGRSEQGQQWYEARGEAHLSLLWLPCLSLLQLSDSAANRFIGASHLCDRRHIGGRPAERITGLVRAGKCEPN